MTSAASGDAPDSSTSVNGPQLQISPFSLCETAKSVDHRSSVKKEEKTADFADGRRLKPDEFDSISVIVTVRLRHCPEKGNA
jgi:hypothetical protein